MKLIYNQFFRVFAVMILLSVASISQAANYYWVGGSGNWSDHNNHWATISGGAVFHNQVPSPFDNVIFDANSFTAAGQTVTLDVEAFCNNFTFSGVLHQPTIVGVLKNVNVDGDFLIENTPFTYNITGKLLVEGDFTISNMPATMVFTHNSDVFEVGGDFLIANSQLDYNINNTMTVHGAFTISGSNMDYDYNSGTLTVDSTFTITNSDMDYRHRGAFNVGQDFLVENSDMYFYHVNGNMNIGSATYAGDFTFRDCNLLTTNGDHYISNGYTNKIYGDWLFDNVNSPTVRMRTYATTTVYGDYTLRDVEFSQYYQANYGLTVYEDFNLLDDVSDFYHTTTMTLYGSFLINHPDIEYTKTGWIYFYSDDPGETITSTGHDLYRGYFHSQGGSAGEWTFVDDFFTSDQTYHIAGSIISGGNSVNFGYRYYARSWSNAKSIDFTGTDTIYVERGFEMYNNPSTQTLILDNAVLKFEYTGNSNFEFYAGGQTYNDVIFNHLWTSASANTIYIRNNNSTFGDIKATINNGSGIYVVGSGNDLGNVSINYQNPGNYNLNTTWNRSGGTNTFGDYTITKSGRMSPGLYFDNDNTFGTMTIPEGSRLNMKQNKVQTMDDLVANGTCLERIYINSLSSGTKATLNVVSGSVDIDYAILKDIEAIGGAAFNATNTVDVSNNTGWTITPPAGNDFYWIGDAGNWNDPAHWSFSSGGTSANCVPIFTDNVIFDANSFTLADQSVTLDVAAECNDMTWTSDVFGSPNMVGSKAINVYGDLNINGVMDWTQSGVVTVYGDMSIPGTANWNHPNGLYLYGSITLGTGMTWSNTNWTYFYATDPGHTIDMGGHEFNYNVYLHSQAPGNGEWTLADDFKINASYQLYHVGGSFISAGFGVDFGYRYYSRSWGNQKSLDFTGTDTVYVDRGFEMHNNPGLHSISMGGAVLKFEYNTNSNFEFYPGGQTYGDVVFEHLWTTTSANTIYIRDANSTFGNIYATINNGTGLYVTGGGNTFGDVNIHYANPGGYSYNTTWNRSAGINTFGDYTITKVGKASVGLYTDNDNTWGTLSVPSLARVYFRYNKTQTMDNLIANGLCDEIVSFQSTSGGTQATISVATDTVKIDNVTLKDMNATGGAIFEASNVNDLGNNTGWTIIPAPSLTFYWINGAGAWNDANHWSLSSGGPVAGCIPQFKDDVVFDDLSFSAASEAATVNVNFEIRNMTWTADVFGMPNLAGSSQLIINGDVQVDGPMTWSHTGNLYLRGSIALNPDVIFNHDGNTYFYSDNNDNTIDMAGKSFTRHVYFNWKTTNATPQWTLLDDYVLSNTGYTTYFYTGTLISNGYNITAGYNFDAYYNYNKTFDFTGTDSINMRSEWRIYPTNQTSVVTNLTIDEATIYISTVGNEYARFYGGNMDYYDVVIDYNSTYGGWRYVYLNHKNNYRDVTVNFNTTANYRRVYHQDMVNNTMRDFYVNYNGGNNLIVYLNSGANTGNTFRDITIEHLRDVSGSQTYLYGDDNTYRHFHLKNPGATPRQELYTYHDNSFDTLELDNRFKLSLQGTNTTQTVGTFIPHSDCNYRSTITATNVANAISQATGTVNSEWINLNNHTVTGGATFNATDATVTGTVNGWNATPEPPHNLYWVGDNGNWNDPDHWALSSGGPGNGCLIPTIRDNVFFDGFSFSGTGYSVNMNTTGLCNNMIWNGASADMPTFTGGGQLSVHGDLVVADDMTWNQSGNLYLYGSMTLNSDMTWNHPTWTRFVSTDADNTIDMAGHTFDYHVEFNGTGGEWTLEDDYGFTSPNSHYTDYNAGSFVSGGYGVDFGYQMDANNSGVKNWNFTGTDTVNVGRIWRVNPSNSSLTAGNSLLLMEWSGNNAMDFYGGGLEYYDVVFDHNYTGNQNIRIYDNNTWNNVFFYPRNNEKTITINGNQMFNDVLFEIVNDNVSYTTEVYFNGSNTFNNFVLLSPGTSGPFIYFYEDNYFNSFVSGGRGTRFYLGATKTQYVNTDLVLGTGSNPVFLYSTVEGVQANVNKNGGVVCLDFVWLRDQNATGTAEFFAGASSTDLGNNTNWQFGTSCVGYYWVGNSGNWSDAANHWATSSGGTDFHVIPPDQSDNVWFDVNSFTETDAIVTIDVDDPRARDMNWQSAFYTPTLVGTADSISLHGELKLTSAMNMDWEGEWVFKSAEDTTVHAINTSGHTLENVTLAGPGATVNTVGTWQLENNLEVANTLNFERGTLLTNDNSVTTQYFDISTDQYRVLNLAGSEINIVDGAFNVSNVNNLSVSPGTSEIIIQSDGGSSDFIGAGLTYNDLTFATNTSMEGDLLGNNTFNTLKFEPGVTASIEASTTQITNAILANGSCQQEITINSTNPGMQATFSQSTGAVEVEFVNLQDNNATGGATFTANLSNDLGNVTGWGFTSNPVLGLTVTKWDATCPLPSNGSAKAVVTGGVAPITYEWSTLAVTDSIGGLVQGTYWVMAIDSNGCTAIDTFEINQPASFGFMIAADGGAEICYLADNGSASVSVDELALQPVSYQWSNNENTNVISGLTAGNYSVTVTDNANCEAVATATVAQGGDLNPQIEHDEIVCEGSEISFSGTGEGLIFSHGFDGTVIDENIFTTGNLTYTQDDELSITGGGGWGQTFRTNETFERVEGTEFTFKYFYGANTYNMIGWHGNSTGGTYPDLIYAMYFTSSSGAGQMLIFEDGSNRGDYTSNISLPTSFVVNEWYEGRIVLKAQGADYYLRKLGDADWDLFYSSNHSSETDLRVGFSYAYSGLMITDDWKIKSTSTDFTMDWDFGDGGTDTGADVSHAYANAGTYDVKLVIEKNNGCTDSITSQVVVNELPVITVSDEVNASCGQCDASATLNASGGTAPYTFIGESFNHSFDGTTINSTLFTKDNNGGYTQNDELSLTGNSGWNQYFYTNQTFPREAGNIFSFRYYRGSSDITMVGWYGNSTGSNNYIDLVYGLYFDGGYLGIYEDGSSRGNVAGNVPGGVTLNTWYDIKIILKDNGADYYVKKDSDAEFALVYASSYSSETDLRLGINHYNGTSKTDDWTVTSPITGTSWPLTNLCPDSTYIFAIVDSLGCTTSITYDVDVIDNVVDTVVCQDINLELEPNNMVTVTADDIDNGSADSCGIDSMYVTGEQLTFDCAVVGQTFTVQLHVVDINSNEDSCTAQVTIVDNTNPCNGPPNALCQNLNVDTNNGACTATVSADAFDNGSTDPDGDTMTFVADPAGPYVLGTTNVMIIVSDPSGASDTCFADVTVADNEDPVITCPDDVTVSTDAGSCQATGVSLGTATVTDNCSTITPTNDAPTAYVLGDNTVTWTADDGNGNVVTCTQTVTVEDNEDPTITCPDDLTVSADSGSCEATSVSLGTATVADNCSTITPTNDAPASYVLGDNTVTWSADDGNGNVVTCAQTVTVEDNENPEITCSADITVDTDPGVCEAAVTVTAPTVIDNCESVQLGNGLYFDGVNDYISTNLDIGATAMPSITMEAWIKPTSNSGFRQWLHDEDGCCWDRGMYTLNNQFIIPVGNGYWYPGVNQILNEWQHVAVVFTPSNVLFYHNGIESNRGIAPVPQNSGIGLQIGKITSGGGYAAGSMDELRIWNVARTLAEINSAMNAEFTGNQNGLVAYYNFNQGTSQDINTGIDTLEDQTSNGNDGSLINFALNGSTSNWVDGATFSFTPTLVNDFNNTNDASDVYPIGTTTVTWTATDAAGNTATCTQDIIVTDDEDPVITCPADINDIATSAAGAVVTFTTPVGTDNCSATSTQTAGLASGSTFPIGTTTNTFTVTDDAGNSTSCSFDVIVEGLPPVIVCPANITVDTDAGACDAVVTFAATETTAIPASTITYDINPGSTFGLGTTSVTAIATNAVGADTCTFTVTVEDNEAPTVVCQDVTIELDSNGNASITDVDINNGSIDACGIASVALDITTFDCSDLGGGQPNNYALDFDGSNDWVKVSDKVSAASLGLPTSEITLESWVNPKSYSIWRSMVSFFQDNGSFERGWDLETRSGGRFAFALNSVGGGGGLTYMESTNSFSTNEWHHVAGVYDGTTMKIYIDGQLENTSTAENGDIWYSDAWLALGMYKDDNENFSIPGTLDEIRIWNIARSQAEIQATMNTTLNGSEPGLVAYYAFEDGPGSTIVSDLSGNGLTGTLNNMDPVTDWIAGSTASGSGGGALVTMTVTDNNGNTSTCAANVTVLDNIPPIIDLEASNQTVECDGAGNTAALNAWLASNGGASASDACGMEWTNDFTALSDECGATGSVTVIFTATDPSSNSASTTATFTIEDTTNPTIAEVAEDDTVECDGAGNTADLDAWLAANGGAIASDICSGVSWSNDFTGLSDACGATGSATVTFTATDDCNNSSSTTATFTIEDTTNPTIAEVAEDDTVECDGAGNTADLDAWLAANGGANASDICSGVSWSNDFTGLSDECGATGSATVTFTATDDCNNSSSTTATFTIEDTTNPTIAEVAEDETVECDGDGNTAELDAWLAANGGANASDICSGVSWSNDFTGLSDECGATGSATVTFTATDDCNNSSSTTATFTIEDTTNPTIAEVAEDETVECDGDGNTAELDAWLAANGGAIASDICSGVSWSNDFTGLSDECGATGSATVTFTATDDCNNSSSTTATFTIEDTTNPTIAEVAEDETVECDGDGNTAELDAWLATNGGAVASDVCSGVTWSNDFVALSDECGATGSATVTFTATDDCDNSSSTTATFTIEDTTNPTIAEVAEDETVECDGDGNTAELDAWLAANGGAVASDVCSGVSWSNDFVALSDECGATGSATVTFTATDDCNNSSSTTATFTIEDTTNPTIAEVAEDETVECDGDGNTAELDAWLAANGGAIASDICSGVSWSNDFAGLSDECGATGSATVTFTATDDCNNSSSTTATFTIEDTTNPTIAEVAEDETVECDGAGNTAELDAWLAANGGAIASDICSGVSWSNDFTGLSDECGATGSATVTFTATDDCNNSSSTTATFTIEDTTNPTIAEVAEDETVECDGDGNTAELDAWLEVNGGAIASDICSGVSWSNDFTGLSDECGATGSATVTFTATDDCNNSSSTTATFTIEDTTNPTIAEVAEDDTVECDGDGNTAELDTWLAANGGAIASDVCSGVSWSNDFAGLSDECGATGSATVTFTATDDCDNSSSTTATFTIEDTTNPTIAEVAEDETVECDGAGNTAELDAWLAANGGAIASDICSGVSWSNDFTGLSDECGATGSATVTFTATDDCNNSSSTTATFTIEDTTNPTIAEVAEDETVECDGDGNTAELDAWLAANGGAIASDVCSGVSWSNDFTGLSDECGATGSATVTFTATDDCNNSSSTTATFTIEDTTNPTIAEVAEDETVECDGAGNTADLDAWLAANGGAIASDVCSGVSWSNDFTGLSDECGATGSATVTFTATDDCDNSSSTTATFTIEDTTNPTIVEVAEDETVECDGAGNTAELDAWLAANGGAIASDVCSGVSWSNDFTGLSDECGATGSATVTFTATDDCDNSSSTTATFTIEDTTNPTIAEVAEDETVECDGDGNTAELDAWLAANGGAIASDICSGVSWSNDFAGLSDECGATGSATVTFTATDDCNNSSSTTATFTIEDTTNPTIAEVAEDETVECDGDGNTAELDAWLAANGGAVASDVCSGVSWSNDFTGLSDECGATGSATVTFTATDDCNNSSSTTATFTIEDTNNPIIAEVAIDKVVECDGAGNTAELNAWLAGNGGAYAFDLCGEISWSNNYVALSDDCGATGSVTVIFTATDACDNSSSTTATFTIEDTTNPTIAEVAEDETVECDGFGNTAELDAWLAANGGAIASDVCSGVSWSNDFAGLSDECGATGSATVTFTATDDCGNFSNTVATFTIEDTIPPAMTCPDDIAICADQVLVTGSAVSWIPPVPLDICSSVNLVSTHEPGDTFPVGITTVTYTATDECGLVTECSFDIEVYELPEVNITESELPIFCQNNVVVLTANVVSNTGGITYDWSIGNTTDTVEVSASGIYEVTVTDANGCERSTSYDVTVDTTGLLSAYTILGIDEVHLHDNNVVVNGGVGVLDDDGKAKIQQNTMITGSTTFVIADDIDVKSGSVVTKQFEGTPNVTLPEFLYNPFGSDNDVTVNSGDTVTLTDQVYGKVDIKEGATVIFTQQDIFIEDLKTKDDVTIQFSGCTFMRIEKNLNLDDDILFNPDGYSVNVYVDANVEVKEGAEVRASIYANDHNINVNGKEDNQTYMYGRFIGKKIDGHKYVNWDWSTACDPTCEPGDPPVVYSCDCDNGMVSMSLVYDGPAGATVEAWYYGNTSLGTFYDVQPGDTLLVDATTIGEDKLKSNTSFYVNGGSEIEFHTSCSDDILNDTINELTVVGWVDGYNQTCGEGGTGIIPELPCNCEDGMVSLSLIYDGPAGATVEAWYYGNTSLGTFYDVQPGDTLLVDATTIGEDKLKSNTSFYVNGGSEIEFHTSCSDDILNDTINELTVVGWVDGDAGVCSDGGTGDYPELPIDCACDGGMVTLSLEYNGPAGVTIEAYYNANTSLGTFYDVQPGDIIMVDATSIGKNKLKSKTSFYVDGGSEIEFHTSCSQDIYDETIDELTVTGWEDKYGNICPPEDSYDNDNGNDEVLHVLHPEVTDLELNPNLTTREVNIPFDLESKIDVFPNPAYGRVNISVTSPDKDIELLFLDRLGRKVWTKTISKEGESSLISVDIQNFSSGVYVIHATLDGKLHTKRLVIIE